MPSYLYACCTEQPVTHSIFDEPQILCPKCGKRMQRRPQPATVQFKASGFYSTDSKSAGKAK